MDRIEENLQRIWAVIQRPRTAEVAVVPAEVVKLEPEVGFRDAPANAIDGFVNKGAVVKANHSPILQLLGKLKFWNTK